MKNTKTIKTTKTKTGLYVCGASGGDRLFLGIARNLQEQLKIKPYFIATLQSNIHFLTEEKIPASQIISINYQNQQEILIPDQKFLQTKEKEYNFRIWDFWEITASRKKKRDSIPKATILCWSEYTIKTFEEIITKTKATHFFIYGPAGFHVLIMYAIAKKHKLRIIDLTGSPLPHRFTLMDSLEPSWPLVAKEYQKILRYGLPKQEEKSALSFIRSYREKPITHDCRKKYSETLFKKAKRYYTYARHSITNRQIPPFWNYYLWPLYQKFYDHIPLYEKPQQEKYVLFCLHFQPEISTSLYGKWFSDQLYLIETIAKALPLNYLLYVKEHPFGYGNRTLRFYQRIKRLPNVRLIGPKENNFELIKNTSLLITITGTSGFEGLLFNKPVITFGNSYYNYCNQVIKLASPTNLPQIIAQTIDKKIKEKEIVKYIASLSRSTFPGLARLPGACAEESAQEQNTTLLAQGIIKYLKEIHS